MPWKIVLESLTAMASRGKRYETIAATLERAIAEGQLTAGERLPTVRQLAEDLRASATTVDAAYKRLQHRGLIQSVVGRGTFVTALADADGSGRIARTVPQPLGRTETIHRRRLKAPWRKRALSASGSYLRSAYPDATDCSSGRPDPTLLPLAILKRAWRTAIEAVAPHDLQYASPDPIVPLTAAVLPRLAVDGVSAAAADLIVGSSAQQWMMLSLKVMSHLTGGAPVVAVEEPGYPTILDSFERAGCRLEGIDVDEHGAVSETLDRALTNGARIVLLTPRAHNPTGASWSPARRAALADVIAAHRDVYVIEDDQFADLTATRPGSLLTDDRIQHRVVYIRSFSKAIAPDLRIAVAVARPQMRSLLSEAKSVTDGWTSRLTQAVLAHLLTDEALDHALDAARAAYARRREIVSHVLTEALVAQGGGVAHGDDGVNVWVHLPPGMESFEVVERAAALGVITAPGEPFFIRPGHGDVLRMNAGAVDVERAHLAAQALAEASTSRIASNATVIAV